MVLIPAFNEEKSVAEVIEGVRKYENNADILIVNDGSHDRTAEIARGTGVMVVNHSCNLGYAAALQTGYRFADSKGYEHIVIMDADGQHDPRSIANLFNAMETSGADVVIGSRFLEGNYNMSFMRRIGVWIFAKIAGFYTGSRLSDPTSGFQILNRKAFSFLASEECYPIDYPDVNIIILLHKRRFSIKEVPVHMVTNDNGKSMHGGLKPIMYVIRMLLAIIIILLRRED
jgi:glycosyltransferase involved in cell wall biosynthesis